MKHFALPALLSIFASVAHAALSPLATPPDWSKLDPYQETITREDFVTLLDKVYAPDGAWKETLTVRDTEALINTRPDAAPFLLRFAPSRAAAKAVPSYWRSRRQLPAAEPGKPLAGLKVALDPGHLGGSWAKMEERWFRIGNSQPVTEGDMTLLVAKLIATRLQSLGAQVYLTRAKPSPVTPLRPGGLKKAAAASLADKGTPATDFSLQKESERLFYRVGEIRRRGKLEGAGGALVPLDQRHDMLIKLLNRSYAEEIALTDLMARKMAAATGLPPYRYEGTASAIRVNSNPYVYARNLLANRLFVCPVVYVEPYVMNSRNVFARIQAGDYDGRRNFGGVQRKSIYREYADSVVDGLLAYYSNRPL